MLRITVEWVMSLYEYGDSGGGLKTFVCDSIETAHELARLEEREWRALGYSVHITETWVCRA